LPHEGRKDVVLLKAEEAHATNNDFPSLSQHHSKVQRDVSTTYAFLFDNNQQALVLKQRRDRPGAHTPTTARASSLELNRDPALRLDPQLLEVLQLHRRARRRAPVVEVRDERLVLLREDAVRPRSARARARAVCVGGHALECAVLGPGHLDVKLVRVRARAHLLARLRALGAHQVVAILVLERLVVPVGHGRPLCAGGVSGARTLREARRACCCVSVFSLSCATMYPVFVAASTVLLAELRK
jgi:hypothetical protein